MKVNVNSQGAFQIFVCRVFLSSAIPHVLCNVELKGGNSGVVGSVLQFLHTEGHIWSRIA